MEIVFQVLLPKKPETEPGVISMERMHLGNKLQTSKSTPWLSPGNTKSIHATDPAHDVISDNI